MQECLFESTLAMQSLLENYTCKIYTDEVQMLIKFTDAAHNLSSTSMRCIGSDHKTQLLKYIRWLICCLKATEARTRTKVALTWLSEGKNFSENIVAFWTVI